MILRFLLCFCIIALEYFAHGLDADWSKKQKCYTRLGGTCIQRNHNCPFKNARTSPIGCPSNYYCCVPPKPTVFHKEITTIKCGRTPLYKSDNTRVVGGYGVKLGELPWQVLIRNYGSAHCGGSILSDRWILTAAHCLYFFPSRLSTFTVSAGLTKLGRSQESEQHVEIEEDYIHPDFNNPEYGNDVALLKLRAPLRFDGFTQPICLPRRHETFEDRVCTVSGWGWNGKENAQNLTAVNLPTVQLEKCKKAPKSGPWIYDSNLCAGFDAGERDACQGDSGGPFACRMTSGQWVLPGLVSWGEGCALKKEPAVMTKVTSFLDWIEDITGLRWD